MTTTTKKQTAANNAYLRAAKKMVNAPIFSTLSAMMNDGRGQSACEAHLAAFGMPSTLPAIEAFVAAHSR